ncbi:MAG: hypothetical protein MZV63_69290 [Marinilabiliales bacterium]|nr:hypothetical protein [Marinilabiliales bacterium]
MLTCCHGSSSTSQSSPLNLYSENDADSARLMSRCSSLPLLTCHCLQEPNDNSQLPVNPDEITVISSRRLTGASEGLALDADPCQHVKRVDQRFIVGASVSPSVGFSIRHRILETVGADEQRKNKADIY